MKAGKIYNAIRLFPLVGIVFFVVFYVLAADLYPGGSRAFPNKAGFDWWNSYWCNLTDHYAINGQINPGKPYALTGIIILCIALAHLFYLFPQYFKLRFPWNKIVIVSGVMACATVLLIHTSLHDLMAILASILGSFTVIALFFGLRRQGWIHFIWTGCLCILLVVTNGYIYFTENYIEYLPFIQKITFAAVLCWFGALNITFGVEQRLNELEK